MQGTPGPSQGTIEVRIAFLASREKTFLIYQPNGLRILPMLSMSVLS